MLRCRKNYLVQYTKFNMACLCAAHTQSAILCGQAGAMQVRCAWIQLCISAGDDVVLEDALAFAAECGRMKFVRPLYKSLHHSAIGKTAGLEQFLRLQDTLHPIARKMVAADLGL